MAGLMNEAAPTGQVPPEQAAQQEQAQPAGLGESEATPEEQDSKDKVVNAAAKLIHDDAMHPKIVKLLQDSAENPAEGIGVAVSQIIIQLDEMSGGKIPETVILPVTEEVLVMIYELGEAAGIFQMDAKLEQEAMNVTVTKVAEHYGVAPEELQAAMEAMDPNMRQQVNDEQTQLLGGGEQAQPQPGAM